MGEKLSFFARLGTAVVGLAFLAEDVFGFNAGFDLYTVKDAEQELLLAPAIIIPLSMGLIFDSVS